MERGSGGSAWRLSGRLERADQIRGACGRGTGGGFGGENVAALTREAECAQSSRDDVRKTWLSPPFVVLCIYGPPGATKH